MHLIRRIILKLPFLENKKSFRQFVKFCIVGGVCAILNFLIYDFTTQWFAKNHPFGHEYLIGGLMAFIITAIINYTANKFWTFGNKQKGKEAIRQAGKFLAVMVSGLIINMALLYFCTSLLNFNYRLSWVFATGIVTFWNYTLNRFWTFKAKIVIEF